MRASVVTTARSHAELSRSCDLAVIWLAIKAGLPRHCHDRIGLVEIAELCRRHAASHQGDRHDLRDLIFMIAVEWDLTRDSLDRQTDACVRCVANLLRFGVEKKQANCALPR